MKRIYLSDHFSPTMLVGTDADIREISIDSAKVVLEKGFISAVSNEFEASKFSKILGYDVETSEIKPKLKNGDILIFISIRDLLDNYKKETCAIRYRIFKIRNTSV